MFDTLKSHLSVQDTIEIGLLVICLILFWFAPRFMNPVFTAFEMAGARLARNKRSALLVIAFGVVALRLCILPLIPVPFPQVHDEFSYLLAGDTLAHGRLANPPHQMWIFFDTFHVNQQPTYMSKYPPAQGAVLALGEILGHPWIGVLLSCGAMCVAVLWALQGWLPPKWALLGAVLLMVRISLFSYWMNSYWGGAVAATGGALVIGAFPRILRRWRIRDSMLLALGAAILANSRPFEGLVFCIPVAFGLIFILWKKRTEFWKKLLPRMVIPLWVAATICGAFMAYYNFRETGHPFLFPYTINNRTYMSAPTFIWETPREPFHHTSPQLDRFYNGWARDSLLQRRAHIIQSTARATLLDIARLAYFFLWPELCLVAPALLWLVCDKRLRFVLLQLVICVGGFVLVPWFYPHYAAPLAGTLFLAVTQGLRHLRHWKYKDRSVGVGFSRAIVLFWVLLMPPLYRFDPRLPPQMSYRAQIAEQLNGMPGNHLVIVRYSDRHDESAEWVYNNADIDHSKIVWAREIPGVDLKQLLAYFRGRRVWLVEPDSSRPLLTSQPE